MLSTIIFLFGVELLSDVNDISLDLSNLLFQQLDITHQILLVFQRFILGSEHLISKQFIHTFVDDKYEYKDQQCDVDRVGS